MLRWKYLLQKSSGSGIALRIKEEWLEWGVKGGVRNGHFKHLKLSLIVALVWFSVLFDVMLHSLVVDLFCKVCSNLDDSVILHELSYCSSLIVFKIKTPLGGSQLLKELKHIFILHIWEKLESFYRILESYGKIDKKNLRLSALWKSFKSCK